MNISTLTINKTFWYKCFLVIEETRDQYMNSNKEIKEAEVM